MLSENRINVKYGRIAYYKYENPTNSDCILFVHGPVAGKKWFKSQFENQKILKNYSWIVPDLIGYGNSTKIDKLDAFDFRQIAEDIYSILHHENIPEIILIGHSMGGIICSYLVKKIMTEDKIKIKLLFNMEGPLQIQDIDDNIGKITFDEYKKQFQIELNNYIKENSPISNFLYNHLKKTGAFTIWAAYRSLTDIVSKENQIDLMEKNFNFPVYYLVGENNRGTSISEKLVKNTNFNLEFIPNSGHNMHIENPKYFWERLNEIILSN